MVLLKVNTYPSPFWPSSWNFFVGCLDTPRKSTGWYLWTQLGPRPRVLVSYPAVPLTQQSLLSYLLTTCWIEEQSRTLHIFPQEKRSYKADLYGWEVFAEGMRERKEASPSRVSLIVLRRGISSSVHPGSAFSSQALLSLCDRIISFVQCPKRIFSALLDKSMKIKQNINYFKLLQSTPKKLSCCILIMPGFSYPNETRNG